jgi:hypothetical protein
MKTQVNSDRTVSVDARVKRFVGDEAGRILRNFDGRITRLEVHLNDVNSRRKEGPADKRCLVEARPAGAKPLTTSATADHFDQAIGLALRKMQRKLASFFGRHDRVSGGNTPARGVKAARKRGAAAKAPAKAARKAAPKKRAASARKRAASAAPASAESSPASASGRSAKKKGIFLARRKAWPVR